MSTQRYNANIHYNFIYNSQKLEITKCSTSELINKLWDTHAIEYYTAIKGKLLIHATTNMELKINMLSERIR